MKSWGKPQLDVSGFIQFADLCATQREIYAV